ncbi:hypothetical protein A3757_14795 [Oleiphilus sp. HI0117]|nr:hypothetical protein A3732_13645 [Oleiphilus sp. HI0050]KZZ35854.1 hypothetical protein A3757_14795 [Oleiphilus sp. HI0117]KZZ61468.1 hypothetical protein A3761_20965 [Oleiphilus sp. HI0123]
MMEAKPMSNNLSGESRVKFLVICAIYGPAIITLKFGVGFSVLYLLFIFLLVKTNKLFIERCKYSAFKYFIVCAPLLMLGLAVAKTIVSENDYLNGVFFFFLALVFVTSVIVTNKSREFVLSDGD